MASRDRPALIVDFGSGFDAEGDSWIDASAGTGFLGTNVSITLLRDDAQLAFDDAATTGAINAQLIHHVRDAGRYCLRVTEASEESVLPFDYAVRVTPIDFERYEGFNLDAEPNDTLDSPQRGLTFYTNVDTGQISAGLAGHFESASDVDVFEVTAPAGAVSLALDLRAPGPGASGSTVELGRVSLYSGGVLRARVDGTNRIPQLAAPIEEGTVYQIQIEPSGELGDNPFWFVRVSTSDGDNPLEGPGDNDSAATAETATGFSLFERTSYFIGGDLPIGDEDWWAIEAIVGDTIELTCGATRIGSGARDMRVSLYGDPGLAALQSEVENATATLRWGSHADATGAGVVAAETRTHYVSITAGTNDPDITSRYYRCGVIVVHP